MALARLASADASSSTSCLAALLNLEGIFALALASQHCHDLCSQALRCVRLQQLQEAGDPAATLRRLAKSSLCVRGDALQEIDASFCPSLRAETFGTLPKLPNLQVLNLDGSRSLDDEALVAVAQRFPALRSLGLYANLKVTDVGVGRVLRAQQGKELLRVNFSGCERLTDETLQRLVGKGPKLAFLDLTRCPLISHVGVLLVCECLDNLRVLRLFAMGQLLEKAFSSLGRLTLLEELDLCGCKVQDKPLLELISGTTPSRLHTLNLTWCTQITDSVAHAIAKHCSNLTWLSYFGNTNITAAAIEALAAGPSGAKIRALDVRGLINARPYHTDAKKLRCLFPRLRQIELHH